MSYIIVTGSSKGLGRDLIYKLLNDGRSVIGLSRSGSLFDSESYIDIRCDITDPSQVSSFVKYIQSNRLKIDALINCTGVARSTLVAFETSENMASLYETNVFGTFNMCASVSKLMMRNKNGVIVNIGSVLTKMHLAGGVAYTSSKAAVEEITKIIAAEMYEFNIKAYCINLAPYNSEMLSSQNEAFVKEIFNRMVQKKPLDVEQIYPWVKNLIDLDSKIFSGTTFNAGML